MEVSKTTVANATDCLKKNRLEGEPLITANKSKFWAKILDPLIFKMVENNFYSIRIKNKKNYYLNNPEYARLLYGVHSCFHDGQLAYYICKKVFDANFYIMIQDLYKLPLLSKLGAFSVEKDSPSESIKSINYAANLLKDKESMLWIFPQGRVMPPEHRPVKFESGLSYLCNKVRGVNLIPVAVKYTFVRMHKPEIFIEIGKPIIIENVLPDKKEFTQYLEEKFTCQLNAQKKMISQGKFDEYEFIYQGKPPLCRRLEPIFKDIVFDKRYLKRLKD